MSFSSQHAGMGAAEGARQAMNKRRRQALVAAVVALAIAAPALADVKAGVDAWARGNYDAAVREWRDPAAAGDPDALFNMAQAYRLGRGVEQDQRQAETLYARAAAQGHVQAADNYGLLLFQDGRREDAMPYVRAAAERGDPRAQYLLGIAHFNGDLVAKDWVRAYALLTLANGAGLPQAPSALRQMDGYIPLAQRQAAQTLAQEIKRDSDARRAHQMAALDLALFAENNWVYLTYSAGTREANRTVLARGVLREGAFTDLTTLWEVSQPKPGGQHFGSRILFLPDGSMLVAIGDGGNPPVRLDGGLIRDNAQNLKSHYGKVVRLTDEGRPAEGNPFAGRPDADPAVWTLGHRNIQGMAIDPASGRVWATEHGARGGDELNLLVAGTNYGWPKATYSIEYWGPRISEHEALEGMADPVAVWTPCIAPSGLVFYTGDKFPAWRGNLLAGGLVSNDVRRVVLDDPAGASPRMVNQDRLRFDGRVRDVRQGPDGLIYVLTDERPGKLIRVEPGP
ncbi:PQQ-dependent sugar dehydrogenase [Leptolyngbya sp. 15MV]|nr:PQQ-dependent sugar dehydrogenase [Leptolyngbya sp. 15MV]